MCSIELHKRPGFPCKLIPLYFKPVKHSGIFNLMVRLSHEIINDEKNLLFPLVSPTGQTILYRFPLQPPVSPIPIEQTAFAHLNSAGYSAYKVAVWAEYLWREMPSHTYKRWLLQPWTQFSTRQHVPKTALIKKKKEKKVPYNGKNNALKIWVCSNCLHCCFFKPRNGPMLTSGSQN